VIDWQLLSATLAVQLQQPLSEAQARPLAGGGINRTFRLDCGTDRFFIKLNEAARESMFVAERAGLETIQRSRTIRTPAVHLTGSDDEYAYIGHFAIDRGYSDRRELYNLYHLLNHANLFGRAYTAQAQAVIERLLEKIS
jgi:fructosamine-3-kinase